MENISINNIQQQLLFLSNIGFIELTARQQKMLDAYAEKYQNMGISTQIYNELIKDAKLLILFS